MKKVIIKTPKDMPKYCTSDGTKLVKEPILGKDKEGKRVILIGGLHCSTCNKMYFGDKSDDLKYNSNNTNI